jgi:naphthalene 1,2-dioxygenase system ferredoxin subunit
VSWIGAVRVSDLADGEMVAVELDGRDVVVARVGNEFFALGNTCSHLGAQLEQGRVIGEEVKCPLHAGRFDLRTGKATRGPAREPVPCYQTRVEGETVQVLFLD